MERIKTSSEEKQNEEFVEWNHQELSTFDAHALHVTQQYFALRQLKYILPTGYLVIHMG